MIGRSVLHAEGITVESVGRQRGLAPVVARWATLLETVLDGQRTVDRARGSDPKSCHYCSKTGHLRWECPKMQAEAKGRGEASKPSQTRGQTSAPRVYELTKDAAEAGPSLVTF